MLEEKAGRAFDIWVLCACIVFCTVFLFGSFRPLEAKDESPPAGVEVCEAPNWHDGDAWKFITKKGELWRDRYDAQNKSDEIHSYDFFPFMGTKLFPIWVGKKHQGTFMMYFTDNSRRPWDYTYEVTGFKEVKVAAGTFKCYEIVFGVRSDMLPRRGLARIYYSPETRSVVKLEDAEFLSHLVMLTNPLTDYELFTIDLKSNDRPFNPSVHSPSGFTCDQDIKDYSTAIALFPDKPFNYLGRANAYSRMAQFDLAAKDHEKAIELKPRYAIVYNDAAWFFATCKDQKYRDGRKAVEFGKEAVSMNKDKAAYYDTLAAAYAESGDFDKAVRMEKKAVEINKAGKYGMSKISTAIFEQLVEAYQNKKTYVGWKAEQKE